MSDYGIKVSKPGVDVSDATDSQLVIDSDQKNIKKTGDIGIFSRTLAASANDTITYAHGMSKIPTYRVFYDASDGYWREGSEISEFLDTLPEIYCSVNADTTNINVFLSNGESTSKTIRVKIFVFTDGITL